MSEETTITFGAGGNSGELIRQGWSTPEPEFCWAIDTESVVVLPAPAPAARYQMSLDVRPHLRKPRLSKQILIIAVNDLIVKVSEVTDNATITCDVPLLAVALADEVRIRIIHPNGATPRDMADIDDDRALSVALERLSFRSFGMLEQSERGSKNWPAAGPKSELNSVGGLSATSSPGVGRRASR